MGPWKHGELCIILRWGLVDAWVLGGDGLEGGRAKNMGAGCLCIKSMQSMSGYSTTCHLFRLRLMDEGGVISV